MSKSGKKPDFGYMKEELSTIRLSMFLQKNSRMNRIINIKIDQLIQCGIVKRLVDAEFEESAKVANKQKEEEKQPKPEKLTMKHLDLCFYAVLIGLFLSCVAFVFELLVGYLSPR